MRKDKPLITHGRSCWYRNHLNRIDADSPTPKKPPKKTKGETRTGTRGTCIYIYMCVCGVCVCVSVSVSVSVSLSVSVSVGVCVCLCSPNANRILSPVCSKRCSHVKSTLHKSNVYIYIYVNIAFIFGGRATRAVQGGD